MNMLINGQQRDLSDFEADELAQAVLISLFSWRRSADDDGVTTPYRQGWWGDTYADTPGDQIGSRLWLLRREKLTNEVMARAREYAQEALQWLIDDAIAQTVTVTAERGEGVSGLDLVVIITRPRDTQAWNARFNDVWGAGDAI